MKGMSTRTISSMMNAKISCYVFSLFFVLPLLPVTVEQLAFPIGNNPNFLAYVDLLCLCLVSKIQQRNMGNTYFMTTRSIPSNPFLSTSILGPYEKRTK